jgi:RNA polymerase sigma factor (TIGR02999 family)
MGEVTTLIRAANSGDSDALNRLFSLLYDDLHRLAHARLRSNTRDILLDTTSLLHETYARLASVEELTLQDRQHFFAYAARAMRFIVVDFARRHHALRRGAGQLHVPLSDDVAAALPERSDEVIRVHEALDQLEQVDPELCRLVEMRYFVGLPVGAVAEALGLSTRTVERHWLKARAILFASIS